jgi:hypothetical protein
MNVNPFDIFTVSELADAINIIPNKYGRLNELNVFPVKGVVTKTITVEEKNGTLALLPPNQPVVGSIGYRKARSFAIPQFVYEEHIDPAEVQGVRSFGGNEVASLAGLLNDKLETGRAKHDITLEHLRMGALKGAIVGGDGATLYDLYTEFGIVQKTVDFTFGTAGTNQLANALSVVRHVEDNLKGEVYGHVHVLASAEWFDNFVGHAKVREAYANYQEAAQRLGGDMRKGFVFGGLTIEEYRGTATDSSGQATRFIAQNEAHAFPVGTSQTFRTYVGPGDFNEAVGAPGQIYYAKVVEAKYGRGYDAHTQSNVLPMCLRPAVLVKLYSSN